MLLTTQQHTKKKLQLISLQQTNRQGMDRGTTLFNNFNLLAI